MQDIGGALLGRVGYRVVRKPGMSWKGWERIRIETGEGDVGAEAIAPVIVSASRSTDIPAFYGSWFMKRLEEGYAKWENPFNRRAQYVSFDRARLIVFWTKNPALFLSHLVELDKTGVSYYFLFTLNDYERENLEPNVPPLEKRIRIFEELSDRIGKGRVVWRFDPLILSDSITPGLLLEKIEAIGDRLFRKTRRMVISFVDIEKYARVKRNLQASGFSDVRQFSIPEMETLSAGLRELNKEWGLEISACGEAHDLSRFGIWKGQCINYDLMVEEFGHDEDLMKFLHPDPGMSREAAIRWLKDPGQRGRCGCVASKDIGQYNTCMHLCTYCYANSSPNLVQRNYEHFIRKSRVSGFGESILD